jgi:aminopeptidase N
MNQRLMIPAFLALTLLPTSSASGAELDVISYTIDATIESERLVETVEMSISSATAVGPLELVLASSVELRSCRLEGRDIPFERSGWDLTLDLKAVGSPRGDFTILFELDGKPHNHQRNKFLRTVISPEHSYIRSQYAWYPRRAEDPARYETRLSVRKDWMARTAGDLQGTEESGDRVIWHYLLDKPTSDIGLAAGAYVSVTRQTDIDLELNALVFEGHEGGAEILLDTAARSIEFFTSLFGPMSERHFTLVEMPPAFGSGSGYGETGYALIGSGAFENAGSASWAESLIVHEVSHTWWGREVVFSDFASEMLATYSTMRFNEQFNGPDAARAERKSFIRRSCSTASEKGLLSLDSIVGFGGSADPAIYSACAYGKAAMLLHALEREAGRRSFDAALKELFEDNRDQTLSYAEVKRQLPGARHKWVFTQWEQAEIPEMSVEYEVKKSGSSYGVKGTLIQQGTDRPFRMEVSLRASAGDEFTEHVVKVRKEETAFKFKCAFEPEVVVIDPDGHLVTSRESVADVEALTKAIFGVANSPGNADPAALRLAIKNARKVIASGQKKAAVYHTAIGRCLFRLGELDAAKGEFAAALEGGAGGPFHRAWIHLRLGCIADLQKDRKTAEAHYEKVMAFSNASSHDHQKGLAEKFLRKAYRGHSVDG